MIKEKGKVVVRNRKANNNNKNSGITGICSKVLYQKEDDEL